ncbi:hypothetical protein FM103_06915 [Corynebacterium xerosis]|nr:hypothetical protein FM103_06915 [Corynebacterium xerosis]
MHLGVELEQPPQDRAVIVCMAVAMGVGRAVVVRRAVARHSALSTIGVRAIRGRAGVRRHPRSLATGVSSITGG